MSCIKYLLVVFNGLFMVSCLLDLFYQLFELEHQWNISTLVSMANNNNNKCSFIMKKITN